ncbi:hypothetical protein GBA65_07720 [Rubrobacter marinus]|uniref:Transmembrane protein n=1 Tax=Rubrobacter marinus TaxID=2653852 RepID=A0A6G8PW36_9ACTN|nr:DUF6069 family protein [Rubrobacter marinus]QIN78431.1 hypothetical protein GBA65_07720 [Rubrobacter marinus]
MQNTQPAPIGTAGISHRRLLLAAPLAAGAAALANALVYAIASALGTIPTDVPVPASGEPITLSPVIVTSVIGALGAAAVFAVIAAISSRPARLFWWVALVVLALSFATPFTIPGAPAAMIASLLLMHVVAWAVSVALLVRLPAARR